MKVRSSRNSRIKFIIQTTGVFGFFILLGFLLPAFFSVVSSVVMAPVHGLNNWYETSSDVIPVMLRDRSELLNQIETLENDLIVSKGEDLTLARLRDENTRLRALLGENKEERILAVVTARPNELPYDLLQVDQGSDAGVLIGAPVYVGGDQLIGVVNHVSTNYSFVRLFTTPGFEMTGFISGPDVIATVEGVGGGISRVRVPQGVSLSVGNLIHVPSVAPGIFGQIDYIENRPSQPEQYGYIALPVALQSLHEVAISKRVVSQSSVEEINQSVTDLIKEKVLVEAANTISFEQASGSASSTLENEI